jgi:nucleoside-triphosphatase THEP1
MIFLHHTSNKAGNVTFNIYSIRMLMSNISRLHVIIIKGTKHQGKTMFAGQVVKQLVEEGYSVRGFLAPGSFKNGRRDSFDIFDIKTGKSKSLCSRDRQAGEKIGPFTFSEEGQQFGRQLLDPANLQQIDFVVIDEIGPLELEGRGWTPSIEKLISKGKRNFIWVVRNSLVEGVAAKFGINDYTIIEAGNCSVRQAVELIKNETGNELTSAI